MSKRAFVERVVAGDTLDFNVSVPDYPATAGWTLKYRLTPRFASPTQAPIDITAATAPDGVSYQVQVGQNTTAQWKPGAYGWARWVEAAGARQTLDEQGQLDVDPNPATTAQGDDLRSHARKMLESVEAALEALNLSAKAYAIGSRSYTRADIAELLTLRSKYLWEVQSEDAAARLKAGMPNPRNVGVRLVR